MGGKREDMFRGVPENTAWARASLRLMRRIGLHGRERALAMELEEVHPATAEDPQWCRLVTELAVGRGVDPAQPGLTPVDMGAYPDPSPSASQHLDPERPPCKRCAGSGLAIEEREHPQVRGSVVGYSVPCGAPGCVEGYNAMLRMEAARRTGPAQPSAQRGPRSQPMRPLAAVPNPPPSPFGGDDTFGDWVDELGRSRDAVGGSESHADGRSGAGEGDHPPVDDRGFWGD